MSGRHFREARNIVNELIIKLKEQNYPIEFQERFRMINQEFVVKRFELDNQKQEFQSIESEFKKTMPNS